MNKAALYYINRSILTYLVSMEVLRRMKKWVLAFNVGFE